MRAIILLVALASTAPAQRPISTIDFQRDIRPILSDNCFACHGPDKNTRMANLRLDLKSDALAPRKRGAAIVPGNPAASAVYQRITATNAALAMPPAHSHKKLTVEQKAILKKWIALGAPWKEHWSFVPPTKGRPALVKNAAWVRNPIDNFVLAKLKAAGLEPAPEADRRTLARRLTLDLTGLPPSPADVEAFVNDTRPDYYDSYVTKLLASPRWGEHRGRYWLDAARYADTHGIHVDNMREMWPYRDWVIAAFNRNLPFDRFTLEQLAGDLLPNRTMDQQIASGFHRCNTTTNEAGVIIEEVEAIYAKDRVDTTGAVWLGLTVGCATCHDHKFDPISTRDFYSMAAFFRNTTQNAMDGNIPDTPPIIVVPREEDRDRWLALNREEPEVKASMDGRRNAGDANFDTWLDSLERKGLTSPLTSELFSLDPKGQTLPKGVRLGEGHVAGRKALYFDKGGSLELPNLPYFASDRPFSISMWFFFPKGEESWVLAAQSDPKDKNRGWQIEIGARVSLLRITGDEGRSMVIRAGHLEQVAPGTWNHLAVTYDGSREQAGMNLFLNGRAIPTQGAGEQNREIKGSIATARPLEFGRNFPNGAISEFRIFSKTMTAEEALLASRWPAMELAKQTSGAALGAAERDGFKLYYLNHRDRDYSALAARLASIAQERREIRRRGSITHVMEERRDREAFAHVLHRGMYDQPRDKVLPNTPSALPAMPASFPRSRLGLAQWLTDPANPLTARVTVNRFWAEVFGTGLVRTADDFGSQGEAPSHPELLDWLAVHFRESGWNVKDFFRLMVTSAAYRQAATTTEDKLRGDPENRLLSRGPRFRMDGEMVRDYALAASGLLTPDIGGPSVKPYQPLGIWETVAMIGSNTRFYVQDHGDKLYRRSLYTFWKRSAPPPSMDIFNAPTRENCTVKRERTNTPLQALVTMNDVQFVEAARRLAQNAIDSSGGDAGRALDFMSGRLLARAFDDRERDVALRAYRDFRAHYDAHASDARKLVAQGESPASANVEPVELAAMTMVANQIMNLDEALNK